MNQNQRFQEIILTQEQRAALLARVQEQISPEDFQIIEGMAHALPDILELIEQSPMTLRKLRHLIFGPKTEKTSRVCPRPDSAAVKKNKGKRKGHGRTKAKDYTGASWVSVAHPKLNGGDLCPDCLKGKVRFQKTPAILLRITGSPPISATGYEMERLRCDACGQVFTAPVPEEAGTQKYDPSVGVTVGLLRYGSGMPHYRLAKFQQSLVFRCPPPLSGK